MAIVPLHDIVDRYQPGVRNYACLAQWYSAGALQVSQINHVSSLTDNCESTTGGIAHKHTVEFAAGINTLVRLSSYQEGNFVSAPNVFMSCTCGLYSLSQRIPARGLKSPLRMDERVVEVGSSKLKVHDSDQSPYFMTISYMTDLLYGLSEALHSAVWNVEADIEIWDRTTRHHVGHGTLENRYTPRKAEGARNGGNGAATAR